MEAMTNQCAAFIDRGADDYMLETAMLKLFTTEALWQIVNDTLQIYGGQGYFSNEPYERMVRDARINQIGEGANDVLRAFIAVVGMRSVGEHLKGVLSAVRHPFREFGTLWRFGREQLSAKMTLPDIPVHGNQIAGDAHELARRVRDFGREVQRVLAHVRKLALADPATAGMDEELRIGQEVIKRQYLQERIAEAACDLYASACTLSRLDFLLTHGNHEPAQVERDVQVGRHFLRIANRRIQQHLAALWDNDDDDTTKTADAALAR
jgi:alkylation response protein AidB-like acyl-CoA dehydrogenase